MYTNAGVQMLIPHNYYDEILAKIIWWIMDLAVNNHSHDLNTLIYMWDKVIPPIYQVYNKCYIIISNSKP